MMVWVMALLSAAFGSGCVLSKCSYDGRMRAVFLVLLAVLGACAADEDEPGVLDRGACDRAMAITFAPDSTGRVNFCRLDFDPAVTSDVFTPSPRYPGNEAGAEMLSVESGTRPAYRNPRVWRSTDGWYAELGTFPEAGGDGVMVYAYPTDYDNDNNCRWVECGVEYPYAEESMHRAAPVPWQP